jgi:hypothetical protein
MPLPAPPPRDTRSDRKKNWLVPAGFGDDSTDKGKEDPLQNLFGSEEDDEQAGPWPDIEVIDPDTVELNEEFIAALLDLPTPDTEETEVRDMTRPSTDSWLGDPVELGGVPDTRQSEALTTGEPWLDDGSGVEGDTFEPMPQTAELLSGVAGRTRDALKPDYGLADLLPKLTELGLPSTTASEPTAGTSLFSGEEGAGEPTSLETPFSTRDQ